MSSMVLSLCDFLTIWSLTLFVRTSIELRQLHAMQPVIVANGRLVGNFSGIIFQQELI